MAPVDEHVRAVAALTVLRENLARTWVRVADEAERFVAAGRLAAMIPHARAQGVALAIVDLDVILSAARRSLHEAQFTAALRSRDAAMPTTTNEMHIDTAAREAYERYDTAVRPNVVEDAFLAGYRARAVETPCVVCEHPYGDHYDVQHLGGGGGTDLDAIAVVRAVQGCSHVGVQCACPGFRSAVEAAIDFLREVVHHERSGYGPWTRGMHSRAEALLDGLTAELRARAE